MRRLDKGGIRDDKEWRAGLEPLQFKDVTSIAAHFETFKNKEHPRKYPGRVSLAPSVTHSNPKSISRFELVSISLQKLNNNDAINVCHFQKKRMLFIYTSPNANPYPPFLT
jgi:hypothetical protein